jgi:hypothetical protein
MTANATGAWEATHRAPREGLDAWTEPNPEAAPAGEVAGQVELQVVGTAGAWAQVRGQNGWEGWVDGRLLEQLDPESGDQRAYVLLAVAVVVLIILAVLGLTG